MTITRRQRQQSPFRLLLLLAHGAFFAAILITILPVVAHSQSSIKKKYPTPTTKSLPDDVDEVKNCIVRVRVDFPTGMSTGTGFLINRDGVVATARHVIFPSGVPPSTGKISIDIRLPTLTTGQIRMVASWDTFKAEVVADDPAHDIAILKPTRNPFPEIRVIESPAGNTSIKPSSATFDLRQLRDGEPVFTSGYPLDLPILITTSGFIASSDPMEFDMATGKIRDILWADIQVNPGNSGGPFFSLKSGNVIGMVVAYRSAPVMFADIGGQGQGAVKTPDGTMASHPLISNSGIAIVLPAEYIVDLLGKNGIKDEVIKGH